MDGEEGIENPERHFSVRRGRKDLDGKRKEKPSENGGNKKDHYALSTSRAAIRYGAGRQ